MGNAEKVFLFGIVNIFALWGFSLKELLVAAFIAPRMNKYPDAISVGDIIFVHYGKGAQIVTGILSVILCAGILGAQIGAMGYITKVFLNVPQIYGILICTLVVIIYSTAGGMRAVVFTDIMQFFVLSVGIPLTLIIGYFYVGGFEAISHAVPASHFSFPGSGKTVLQFVALFLTFLLGETLVPPYVQRLFLAKDSSQTAKGTLWSGLFSIPFFAVTGLIGIIALTLKPDLDPNLAMPYVIKTVLPVGIKGLVVAGVISIVMSSADSFLVAASVAFTRDVITPLSGEQAKSNSQLLVVRTVTFFVGVLAVFFAISIKSVLDILVYSYHFWAPVILIPLTAAIMGVKCDLKHFVAGAIAGAVGVIAWNFILHNPAGIDGLIIGIICNFIFFFASIFVTGDSNRTNNGNQTGETP